MLATASGTLVTRRGSALQTLPRRQAYWIAGQVGAASLTAILALWTLQPEIALTLSLAAGAASVNPKRLWAVPVVATGVTLVGLFCYAMAWPVVIGAGAAAGALATWQIPHRTDWLDYINNALATLTGSSIGLWLASLLVPEALPIGAVAVMTAGVVGIVSSFGLLPSALRFDTPTLPSIRKIRGTLRALYRPPVFKAVDLYRRSVRTRIPDTDQRRGLAEVATWVYHLQVSLQTLDRELDAIDVDSIEKRIDTAEATDSDDEFTRERRLAAAAHLRRLLENRDTIRIERDRTEALVEYALAFLEEARAGLIVARQLPGEAVPDRLGEVLDRLRSQARAGDARRRTAREMAAS